MPVPYMESKRKSAGKIYQTIKNFNPQSKILCDLFCGGFAISEYFIKESWITISNDKNKYVVALIDQIINKQLDQKKCLEFIDRGLFFDIIKNPDNYEDWYVGFAQCIYSFGNSQKAYMYGKGIEVYKKAGHELVVNCNSELLLKLSPDFPQKYIDGIIKQKNWQTRRMALVKVCNNLSNKITELERLQNLERLENIEALTRLEVLNQLSKVQITSGDYKDVIIPDNAVVYCDPPYQGTAEYAEGGFNHTEFWDWVREKSKTNNVYVSEYKAPPDFKTILSFEQKSTLQGGVQKYGNQPAECLFTIIKQSK